MRFAISVLAVLLLSSAVQAETIAVAVAANMMPAMQDIRRGFKAESGIDLALTPGASGKFAAQIEHGAPYDFFVSADMQYPQQLFKDGYATAEPDRYAVGTLILWTMKDVDLSKGLWALIDPSVKAVAIADPKTAPYGRQATAALVSAGLYDVVSGKLVYGDNISQVNQFVATKAADVGFAARSIVMTAEWIGKGKWVEVDRKLYTPIDQGMVVLKKGPLQDRTALDDLRRYILGRKGRRVLRRYGYTLPKAFATPSK